MIIACVVIGLFACTCTYFLGKGVKLNAVEAELQKFETSSIADVKTLVAAVRSHL